MTRFLHTSDWQLGMTRHYLKEGEQEKFAQARIDAIRKLGEIAASESCEFIVVSGDVFDSNQVDRKTVVRALEALGSIPVRVYLLPGNHDPLNEASVFRSPVFLDRKPENVHVLEDEIPIEVGKGVEIVGAPWMAKKIVHDPVAQACSGLEPAKGIRICVAHGMVDKLSPSPDEPDLISLEDAEKFISDGIIHYLALGERHSVEEVGSTGRIWFSGSPEPTAYREPKPGYALVVNLDEKSCDVKEVPVGTWQYVEERVILNTDEDLQALEERLAEIENKERTIVKLRFEGSLNLTQRARLQEILDNIQDLLAALEIREKDLAILPDDADFEDLGFSGFAQKALDTIRDQAGVESEEGETARDALALLVRLAGGAP
jgi:DNA repair exonuclease SbcCD nuclease subunit